VAKEETMLRSLKELRGYALEAVDGPIGSVYDFYFDDQTWSLRYLVAETGNWLPGRKVLLSPAAMGRPDWSGRRLPVKLTREKIRNSPDINTDRSVTRQHEESLARHFGWPAYWAGAGEASWLLAGQRVRAAVEAGRARTATAEKPADPRLRSLREVLGYAVHALDGDIGTIKDVILDDQDGRIRYIAVDTKPWRPGGDVLVSPDWVKEIDWSEAEARVDLPRDRVKNCPAYNPDEPINREYEARMYDFYGRPKYWS
jgi:sporulation protein YlmC with PRC-barrel domain